MGKRFIYFRPDKDPVLPVVKDNPQTRVEKDKFPLTEIIQRTAKYCAFHVSVAETISEIERLKDEHIKDQCVTLRAEVVGMDKDGTAILNIYFDSIVIGNVRSAGEFLETVTRLLG